VQAPRRFPLHIMPYRAVPGRVCTRGIATVCVCGVVDQRGCREPVRMRCSLSSRERTIVSLSHISLILPAHISLVYSPLTYLSYIPLPLTCTCRPTTRHCCHQGHMPRVNSRKSFNCSRHGTVNGTTGGAGTHGIAGGQNAGALLANGGSMGGGSIISQGWSNLYDPLCPRCASLLTRRRRAGAAAAGAAG
jgi:hypothetical protein